MKMIVANETDEIVSSTEAESFLEETPRGMSDH